MNQPMEDLKEESLVSHLIELRSRLIKAGSAVLVLFVCLAPFADFVFSQIAMPLMNQLPEGSTMIATQVASPFLTPFKTTILLRFSSQCLWCSSKCGLSLLQVSMKMKKSLLFRS